MGDEPVRLEYDGVLCVVRPPLDKAGDFGTQLKPALGRRVALDKDFVASNDGRTTRVCAPERETP